MSDFSLTNPLKDCLEACIVAASQRGDTITLTLGDNTTTITLSAGIQKYSNTINYSTGASVSSAGALYLAIAANGPGSTVVTPSTDTTGAAWQKVLTGVNGILSVSSGGTGVTSLPAALMASLPYSASVDYVAGTLVTSGGDLYACIAANGPSTSVAAVTDTTKWAKVILTTATASAAGYMSAADKSLLAGISALS